jgi:autotransporter-associated beta strand protein
LINATYTASNTGIAAANAGQNVTITGSNAAAATNANVAVASLRYADPGNDSVQLGTGTYTFDGILIASTSGGGTLTGGTIRTNHTTNTSLIDFNVIQNSPNPFTIASTITNAGGSDTLVKAGPGKLILTGSNTWGTNETRISMSLNGGTVSASQNVNLGAAAGLNGGNGQIAFNGGGLELTGTMTLGNGAPGRTLTMNTAAPISVTGTNIVTAPGLFAGAGQLMKNGTGTLIMSNTSTGGNTYTGGTQINAGVLRADATANSVGAGAVNVNSTGTLQGSGIITGTVNVNSGGHLAPGDNAVGTLTAGSMTVNSGGVVDFELNPSANDLLNLTTAAANTALTANSGAGFNIFTEGSTSPWTINGTYNVMHVTNGGAITGLGNLAPLNQTGTVTYSLAPVSDGGSGSFIQLTIAGGSNSVAWNIATGGTWNSAGNWNPAAIPHSAGDAATFGSAITAPASVTLDAAQTVGSLTFQNSANSYTITPGSGGTLTFSSGTTGNAFLADKAGNHSINAPVTLTSNLSASVTNSTDTLTIDGNISGGGQLIMGGAGTLILTGTSNSWGGGTLINSGTIQIGNGTTAGTLSGNVTDNGTLAFDHSDPLTVTSAISGNGGVTQLTNTVLTLSGANTYSGPTNVNAGSVKIGAPGALGTGALNLPGTSLDLNGNNASVAGLNGAGTVDSSTAGTMTLTISNTGNFTGLIKNTNGTLSVTKSGGGTETVSGNNTYSGGTTMNGGSMKVTASTTGAPNAVTAGPLGTGTVTVNTGTGLLFGGGGSITFGNSITVAGGVGASSWVDVTDPGTAVTVTGNVAATAANGSQYRLQTTATGATLTLTGTNTVAGTSTNVIFNQGNITFAGNGSLNFTSTVAALFGRATETDGVAGNDLNHLTLTIQDSASVSNAGTGGISLINPMGANPSGFDLVVKNNGILSAGPGPLNFFAATTFAGTPNLPTYTVQSGGTLKAGSFAYTFNNATSGTTATLTSDGGVIAAGASDPTTTPFQWFPNLPLLHFNITTNGVTFDSGTFNVTIAQPFSETGAGATVTKKGTGSVIIAGTNTYSGATSVNAGLLEFTTAAGYGTTPSISAAAGGAVGLDSSSLDMAFLNLLIAAPSPNAGGLALATPDAAANLDFTSGTLANPQLVGMSVGAIRAGVTYTGTITPANNNYRLGGGGTLTLPNANQLTGARSVTFTNGGAVALANSNDYSLGSTVEFGTTVIASNSTGSATGSGDITMNNGTLASGAVGSVAGNVLAGSGAHTIAPGGVGTVGSLTIGGLTSSSLTTLNFDLGTGSGVITNGDLLTLGAGTVSVGAGTNVSLGGTTAAGNDYRLVGGSIGGISLANFTLPAAPTGQSYSLSTSVDPGFIDLIVTPTALTWNNTGGTGDGLTWDTTNQNWNNGTGPSVYSDVANVTFNDTNNAHYAVTINSTVSPASVTVNSTGAYTFSGTGGIGGTGTLTKSGTGSLTISTVNTFSGNTTVSGGTMTIAAGGSIASNNVSVSGGATLNAIGSLASTANVTTAAASSVNFGASGSTAASTQQLASLSIATGSTSSITVSATALTPKTLQVGTLTFGDNNNSSTSKLDITNNILFAGGTAADALDAINKGKVVSTTLINGLALGYKAVTSPAGSYEIRTTLLGDTDLDGHVNVQDLSNLAGNFGITAGGTWLGGDLDYNGTVNIADLSDLAGNFGKDLGPSTGTGGSSAAAAPAAAVAGGASSVPEPASLGLLGFGALGLLARRRRRQS